MDSKKVGLKRRNIRKSEQAKPAAPGSASRRDFKVALTRTNRRGGRK
jgi:hypothetical protein